MVIAVVLVAVPGVVRKIPVVHGDSDGLHEHVLAAKLREEG